MSLLLLYAPSAPVTPPDEEPTVTATPGGLRALALEQELARLARQRARQEEEELLLMIAALTT